MTGGQASPAIPIKSPIKSSRGGRLRKTPRCVRSKSSEPTSRWMDTRHHVSHWGPDGSWWLTRYEQPVAPEGFFDPPRRRADDERCPPSYHGFATAGPSFDRSVLQTRQAMLKGHVDWVYWAKEADDALQFMRRKACSSSPVRKRSFPPDASWCPNYGVVGRDGRFQWPSLAAQTARLPCLDKIRSCLEQQFLQLQCGKSKSDDKSAWRAPCTVVIDVLDKLGPGSVPLGLQWCWWELRTRILAIVKLGNIIFWDDLMAVLDHSVLEIFHEGVDTLPVPAGFPSPDVVKSSLLQVGGLKTSFAFLQARRVLRACGSVSFGRQLVHDRLVVAKRLCGSLCISLDEGNPVTRVARLAAGLCTFPPGMREDMFALGEHRAAFIVTFPDDSVPVRKHRIIAARRACSWSCLDVLSVGVFEGSSVDALQQLEALATAATAYTLAAGWARPAMFLRCYPHCAANVPHLHIVDLGDSGETPVVLGPWDLPVDEALVALREEAAHETRLHNPSNQRANEFRNDLAWEASVQDAIGQLCRLRDGMTSQADSSLEVQNQAATKIQAVQRGRILREHMQASDSASLSTSFQLELAMDQLQTKLAKVRSSTQQAVATLCQDGFHSLPVSSKTFRLVGCD